MTDKLGDAYIAFQDTYKKLCDICEEQAHISVSMEDKRYPVRFCFYPNPQESMFEKDLKNVNEDGEVNSMIISVGITTIVKSNLNFRIDAKLLKKIIKEAQLAGLLYYQFFREMADDEETDP